MTNINDVIRDAVRAPYERRRCVHCNKTGVVGGDYPVPISARGDVFAHVACDADEERFLSRDEADRYLYDTNLDGD